MPQVSQIIAKKGSHVLTVSADATVFDAASLMNEHKVGAVVVLERGRIVGMFTERDVLRRVVGERLDPAQVKVRDVMTRDVVCCQADTDLQDARGIFMQRRIRHLPVVDDERRLHGLVSIGDLNAWHIDGQEVHIHHLQEYIYGRV